MGQMIRGFAELSPEQYVEAGGKGAMLSRMLQAGYPVPEGFVVFPSAFEGDKLKEEAWTESAARLRKIRMSHRNVRFAVRSSGLSEDSAEASFAGEFETVLNVETDEQIREAMYTVYQSKDSERVQVYSSMQDMDSSHKVAIVVQLMIHSEISGVLFTADPITGSRTVLPGNYVYGLGEQLVSGESNAYSFTLARNRGRYEGPDDFKRYAAKLYRYACRLEKELGAPQDIEWAVAKGRVYLLQTRPVTTLNPGNRNTFEINDSLAGDFLWTNTNVGESISGVLTPLTWSILRSLDEEYNIIPGHYVMSGNICGRVYTNVSLSVSMFSAFGLNTKSIWKKMSRVFGELPEGMALPVYPFTKRELLKTVLPKMMHSMKQTRKTVRTLPQFLEDSPEWCRRLTSRLQAATTRKELLSLWKQELWPQNVTALWSALEAPSAQMQKFEKLHKQLSEAVGEEKANMLLSNAGEAAQLESLGPLIGISRVIKGEMSRKEYLVKYGHRGPNEMELSYPDPGEDDAWLDKQIAEFRKAPMDVEDILQRQRVRSGEALKAFERQFPAKAKRIARRIEEASEGPRLREAVRSEWTRTMRVNRAFALKAGELAGIGEDVFFLYLDEIMDWLATGNLTAVQYFSARKQTYARYQSLPPLPSMLRGRFEPFKWAKDPHRRLDYYDASQPVPLSEHPHAERLKGSAGAAGRIEGRVRVLAKPEEGEQFQAGEILVASTINVGWTPLFPRAAAIITDIGAPLSHAAIVARELGIPAVVGCGSATARLKTGDRVIVDGGQGVVELIVN
ncbi:PEP/pyruvate-binding domain-containing protein [Paenibacillus sp. sgz500992]|uniref:PEP/pyruvate-binding domain-containing protein n=1 Tax=Paenibacillus sp. sgz500992 TaxID=3242476 RepID=UPI0036D2D180